MEKIFFKFKVELKRKQYNTLSYPALMLEFIVPFLLSQKATEYFIIIRDTQIILQGLWHPK